MKINGLRYLWRAVDHQGEILDTVVAVKRDKAAALKHEEIWPTAEYRHRQTSSYSAAMKEIGNADRHEVGRRLNNRAENSDQEPAIAH
jgi:putative transposase